MCVRWQGGIFSITFLPKQSGEVSIKVMVNGEVLTNKHLIVRPLSQWTKEVRLSNTGLALVKY